jgi:hypothetical protein
MMSAASSIVISMVDMSFFLIPHGAGPTFEEMSVVMKLQAIMGVIGFAQAMQDIGYCIARPLKAADVEA